MILDLWNDTREHLAWHPLGMPAYNQGLPRPWVRSPPGSRLSCTTETEKTTLLPGCLDEVFDQVVAVLGLEDTMDLQIVVQVFPGP